MLHLSDDEITAIVRKELKQITGLSAEPWFVRVYRWDRAMAQYTPGHLERIERIGETLKQMQNDLHCRQFLQRHRRAGLRAHRQRGGGAHGYSGARVTWRQV